jgi:hypothetical protein
MSTGQLVIKDSPEWGLVKGDILSCHLDGDFRNLRTKKVVDWHCNLRDFCKYVTDITDDELEKGFRS